MTKAPGRWSPAEATRRIRACAADPHFTPHWKAAVLGAKCEEYGLVVGDILHVLRRGTVSQAPAYSDIAGFFRYRVAGRALSVNRVLVVTVVPSGGHDLKVMEIEWKE